MSITVCKFGGSSVCDGDRFAQVRSILRADSDRKFIVLSAPGRRFPGDDKITDLLYQAWDAADDTAQFIFTRIYLRYASIRDQCAPDFDLEEAFAQIRRRFRTSRDYAASRGEYLCARLFASYTGLPFVDASELFHFDADGAINPAATRRAFRERLLPLSRAVIPGFYGSLPDGSVHTFSRGGSDVSGALAAAALDADLYENWTDVDGLFTADPSIVPAARRNRCVSLRQMERLSCAGAQVLHPEALEPLKGTGIDTLLKNTYCPDAEGTRISESCPAFVPCITGRRELYIAADLNPSASCPLLQRAPFEGAIAVASVNAFGLTDAQVKRVEATIDSIHIIHMQDHLRIIIPECEYAATIRRIHEILLCTDEA